jgi:hypothetical protein
MSILVISLCSIAAPRTYYIKPDDSGDAPTIAAALDSTVRGDTVLVAPGIYHLNVAMVDGVVLLGEEGREDTGLRPLTHGPMIRCTDLTPGTVIQGFSFERGQADFGGAINCVRSAVAILNNSFSVNHALNDGGAIACSLSAGEGNLLIEGNVFRHNRANGWAGGIFCTRCSPVIRGNTLTHCSAKYGAAIGCVDSSAPLISRNVIELNSCMASGGGIHVNHHSSPVIEGNIIRENSADGTGGGIYIARSVFDIRGNLFHRNKGEYGSGLNVAFGSKGLCESNTFWGHRATAIRCKGGSTLEVYRCIIAGSPREPAVHCGDGSTVKLTCNDLWSNDTDYSGCEPGIGDYSEDPLFCDIAVGNFMLQECSPCIDRDGCGRIGAYGSDCPCGGTPQHRDTVPRPSRYTSENPG